MGNCIVATSFVPHAEVAELVDALASGASELLLVEVQVLFSAPTSSLENSKGRKQIPH